MMQRASRSGAAGPTIADALAEREQQLFVGRDREVELFRSWLAGPAGTPKILSVTGPGGIGKSTLLRAFARLAEAGGRPVAMVDGRVVEPTPQAVAAAVGVTSVAEAVGALNETRPLLLFDSFEDLRPLTHFLLDEFLPALHRDVAVVIGSRQDVTAGWRPWREVVRLLPLTGLSPEHARELLRRRGVPDPGGLAEALSVAGGHPLSLAVAADLALRGVRPTEEAPEWRMAIRHLVEDLLRYEDPALQALLEAAALLRQFDEAILSEVSPGDDVPGAFARLCTLSVVRPGPRGLMLHDEVRRSIREDLRWRNPERFQELRRRALASYRRRQEEIGGAGDSWLFNEILYLSEDPFVHLGMFTADDPAERWVEEGRPADREALLALHRALRDGLEERREQPPAEELDPEILSALLDIPDARLRVAWHRTDGITGYGLALRMTAPILDLLPPDGAIAQLAGSALGASSPADLRRRADGTEAWYLGTVIAPPAEAEATVAVLTREITRLFAAPRLFLACTGDPVYGSLLTAFGSARTPLTDGPGGPPIDGYVLDLRLLGSERLLDQVLAGVPLPALPTVEGLRPALEEALEGWQDDEVLAGSALVSATWYLDGTGSAVPIGTAAADAVRRLVRTLIEAVRVGGAAVEDDIRAVELGYLEGAPKLEAAARRLAVSRPTFYRMRQRMLRALVDTLVDVLRTGQLPGGEA